MDIKHLEILSKLDKLLKHIDVKDYPGLTHYQVIHTILHTIEELDKKKCKLQLVR